MSSFVDIKPQDKHITEKKIVEDSTNHEGKSTAAKSTIYFKGMSVCYIYMRNTYLAAFFCMLYSAIVDVRGVILHYLIIGAVLNAFIYNLAMGNAVNERENCIKFYTSLASLFFMSFSVLICANDNVLYLAFIIISALIFVFSYNSYKGIALANGEISVITSLLLFFSILFSPLFYIDTDGNNRTFIVCGVLILVFICISCIRNNVASDIYIVFVIIGAVIYFHILITRSIGVNIRKSDSSAPAPQIFLNLKEEYFGLYLQNPSFNDQKLMAGYIDKFSDENSLAINSTHESLKNYHFNNSIVCGSTFRDFTTVPYASWTLSEWFNIKNYTAVPYFYLTSSEYSNMIEKTNNIVHISVSIPQNLFCTEYNQVQKCGVSLLTGSLKKVENDSNVENFLKLSLIDRSNEHKVPEDNELFVKMDVSNISIFKISECHSTLTLKKYQASFL